MLETRHQTRDAHKPSGYRKRHWKNRRTCEWASNSLISSIRRRINTSCACRVKSVVSRAARHTGTLYQNLREIASCAIIWWVAAHTIHVGAGRTASINIDDGLALRAWAQTSVDVEIVIGWALGAGLCWGASCTLRRALGAVSALSVVADVAGA